MKVINMGIIIRNDHNDTFPVALNPQMVGLIQNLLTQIPLQQSQIVDGSGKKVTANASIPIIPRRVEFDWEGTYASMMPEEEKKLMAELVEKYKATEAVATEVVEGDPDNKVESLNPMRLESSGEGRSNVDLEKAGSDTEPNPDADDKVGIGTDKAEEGRANVDIEGQDCTVKPDALGLGSKPGVPGS